MSESDLAIFRGQREWAHKRYDSQQMSTSSRGECSECGRTKLCLLGLCVKESLLTTGQCQCKACETFICVAFALKYLERHLNNCVLKRFAPPLQLLAISCDTIFFPQEAIEGMFYCVSCEGCSFTYINCHLSKNTHAVTKNGPAILLLYILQRENCHLYGYPFIPCT